MAFPSLNYTPDFGAQKTKKPSTSTIQFGDGYAQRVQYGINTDPESWAVSFSNRTKAEAQAIDDFLTARRGMEPFSWVTPDGIDKNFVCSEWNRVAISAAYDSISATFVEVFDPE